MKTNQLLTALKLVMRHLEKDYMSCKMSGNSHYPTLDCVSCRAGIVYSFLENYIDDLEYENKNKS